MDIAAQKRLRKVMGSQIIRVMEKNHIGLGEDRVTMWLPGPYGLGKAN
jgi:hypothetical protein